MNLTIFMILGIGAAATIGLTLVAIALEKVNA